MMKQICFSMGYCLGFSSYTFGVNFLLTTSFLFGFIRAFEAHQDKIVALVLVLRTNIFYLLCVWTMTKKTHFSYSSITNNEEPWPHFLNAFSMLEIFIEQKCLNHDLQVLLRWHAL